MSSETASVGLTDDLQNILGLRLVESRSDPVVPPDPLTRGDVGEIKFHPVVLENLDKFLLPNRLLIRKARPLVDGRLLGGITDLLHSLRNRLDKSRLRRGGQQSGLDRTPLGLEIHARIIPLVEGHLHVVFRHNKRGRGGDYRRLGIESLVDYQI